MCQTVRDVVVRARWRRIHSNKFKPFNTDRVCDHNKNKEEIDDGLLSLYGWFLAVTEDKYTTTTAGK